MIVNELIMTHKTGRQQATGNSCPTIRQSTAPASQSVTYLLRAVYCGHILSFSGLRFGLALLGGTPVSCSCCLNKYSDFIALSYVLHRAGVLFAFLGNNRAWLCDIHC